MLEPQTLFIFKHFEWMQDVTESLSCFSRPKKCLMKKKLL